MPSNITRFQIEGLHNLRTISIPIQDNKLVLVGENGTGKSTVANFIYFLLTMQWSKMLKTIFKSVSTTVNGSEFTFDREVIRQLSAESSLIKRGSHLPSFLIREFEAMADLSTAERKRFISRLGAETGLPARVLERELLRLSADISAKDREMVRSLRSELKDQVLYLPTYRRIEQDLEAILPDIDIERLRRSRKATISNRYEQTRHIELVEFGMEDVEATIQQRMSDIKDRVRRDLNNLTGEYLRDIIQGAYKSVSPEQLSTIQSYSVDDIFKRIPEDILPEGDKAALKEIIADIIRSGQINDDNRVVAHFLTKLVELYERQQVEERDIREFVQVCNESYLTGKEFIYDDVGFNVIIQQHENGNKQPRHLAMQALSSGEKQIVSLFSHLYLTGRSDFFVVIDEPELSLSVPWQKHLLPDILRRSSGLIAVTHSPFIYDNELERYTHSLDEFIEPFEYDPALESSNLLSDDIHSGD